MVVQKISSNCVCAIKAFMWGYLWHYGFSHFTAREDKLGLSCSCLLNVFFLQNWVDDWWYVHSNKACQTQPDKILLNSHLIYSQHSMQQSWWLQVNVLHFNKITVCLLGFEVYASFVCQPGQSQSHKESQLYTEIFYLLRRCFCQKRKQWSN